MLRTQIVSAGRWSDVASVMGCNRVAASCWCMFWRLTNADLADQHPDALRSSLRTLVDSEPSIGLLAYDDEMPIGWCQVAPRPAFKRVFRTKGLDLDQPLREDVWSIVCILLTPQARGRGVANLLVEAAVELARRQDASRIEAYPIAKHTRRRSQLSSGTVGLFRRAGFTATEGSVGRRSVMERTLSAPNSEEKHR